MTLNLLHLFYITFQAAGDDVDEVNDKKDNDSKGEASMLHLASFALYKLFSEWQADGFEIPGFKAGPLDTKIDRVVAAKVPAAPPKRTHLPENAHTIHPTRLLCIVNPILAKKSLRLC